MTPFWHLMCFPIEHFIVGFMVTITTLPCDIVVLWMMGLVGGKQIYVLWWYHFVVASTPIMFTVSCSFTVTHLLPNSKMFYKTIISTTVVVKAYKWSTQVNTEQKSFQVTWKIYPLCVFTSVVSTTRQKSCEGMSSFRELSSLHNHQWAI